MYKSGNDFVCDNMRRNPRLGEILEKQKRPEAMQCPLEPQLAFTFVREPLTHFVSGFSELMFRLAHPEQFVSRVQLAFNGYDAQGVRFHKARLGDAPEAFILDFIDGKFKGGFASAAEVHAWPQVAFLSQHVRAGFSVGMIADLDDSDRESEMATRAHMARPRRMTSPRRASSSRPSRPKVSNM